MPRYAYKARSHGGTPQIGDVDADSMPAAARMLIGRGLVPSNIEEMREGGSLAPAALRQRFDKVKPEELVLFTTQLETLFRAGIPLVDCLSALIEQAGSGAFRRALEVVRRSVTDGAALHEAMAQHPAIFSETCVNMVMAGEISGMLDDSLNRLTRLLERQDAATKRIAEVMRYPKIVAGALFIAVTVLMIFVVPRFAEFFEKGKLALPLPTRILIAVSYGFQHYWLAGVIMAAAAALAFRWYIGTEKGRRRWHEFILHAPVIGDIFVKLTMGQFCHSLANLIRSGVPALQAIEVAGRTAGNVFLVKIFDEVAASVREGSGLSAPLGRHKLIPPIAVRMIAAGEGSGALDEMLMKVGDHFDREAERKIRLLSLLIEPALIVLLGGIVLFVALSIFLPMWDMTKLARPLH